MVTQRKRKKKSARMSNARYNIGEGDCNQPIMADWVVCALSNPGVQIKLCFSDVSFHHNAVVQMKLACHLHFLLTSEGH
jgi:hypothetical protein